MEYSQCCLVVGFRFTKNGGIAMDKINELVDAINELMKYIGVPDKLKTL